MNSIPHVYGSEYFSTPLVPVLMVLLLAALPALLLYIRYLRGLKGNVYLVWLVGLLLGVLVSVQQLRQGPQRSDPIPRGWVFSPGQGWSMEQSMWIGFSARLLCALSAVALVFKLYRKWIGGDVTPEENATGNQALRAWFSGENIVCCLIISLGAWQGYGYSFWGILALAGCALAAYPLIRSLLQTGPAPAVPTPAEDLSAERERVLKLLEAGKITAEESAQLLSALGETTRPPLPPTAVVTPTGKMILAGGLAVVVGFFLPWFVVNVGQELTNAAQQLGNFAQMNIPIKLNTGSLRIAGGDIPHGLGWIVLLLGIAAVALPYLNPGLSRSAQMKIALVALGAGLLVLIYLLTNNLRFASVGFILTGAGYALMLAGTLKEARGTLMLGALQRNAG